MLDLEAVGHVYDAGTPWEHRALTDVSLVVGVAEAVAVHGHNGSGKSTLFRIIAGLTAPTEGRVRLDGVPVSEARDRVGACLQNARLQLFGATVGEDLTLDPAVDIPTAAAALRSVGLDPVDMHSRRIDELSGGQQRLVAIAGALVRRPRLVVLDEPFAGIDTGNATAVLDALAQAREAGVATLVLTPDPEEAHCCGRVVELAGGSTC